jgi:hypothetical protein
LAAQTEQAENHFEICISTDNNREEKTILTKICKYFSAATVLGISNRCAICCGLKKADNSSIYFKISLDSGASQQFSAWSSRSVLERGGSAPLLSWALTCDDTRYYSGRRRVFGGKPATCARPFTAKSGAEPPHSPKRFGRIGGEASFRRLVVEP